MAVEEQIDQLPELNEATLADAAGAEAVADERPSSAADKLGLVMDVPLRLSVQIGSARLLVRDVLQLAKGAVVELDRMNGEPADVFVNDRLIGKGEVTVVDDRLAIRIVEVVDNSRV